MREFEEGIWPVFPMEPVPRNDAFDSPEHFFELKWDGVRCLAYRGDSVRLFNRKKRERTQQYPELTAELADLPPGTVVDGEIVALDKTGKPNFPLVLKRDLAMRALPGRIAAVPVQYVIFDILWHKGGRVTGLPLEERKKLLRDTVRESSRIRIAESFTNSGKALFEAVCAEGLEGVVAKHKASPYVVGEKSALWQKIKCFRELDAMVLGWTHDESGRMRSLAVGINGPEGIVFIGTVSSGITQAQWKKLSERLLAAESECPFAEPPAEKNIRFARPGINVRVRYLEYSENGRLRNPAVISFSGLEGKNG